MIYTGQSSSSNDIYTMMRSEWESLRKEQEFLKRCQLQYFLFSITVVGLFIGLSHLHGDDTKKIMEEQGWLFLTPLIVTIPCWWIFFDKCKTIARLVGYLRILEELSLTKSPHDLKLYIGWERSIGFFRTDYTSDQMRRNKNVFSYGKNGRRLRLLFFYSAHKYWIAHFYCFFLTSLICLLLARNCAFTNTVLYGASVVAVILIALNTFNLLDRLIFGMNSYDAHEEKWWDILEVQAGEVQPGGSPIRSTLIRARRAELLKGSETKLGFVKILRDTCASFGWEWSRKNIASTAPKSPPSHNPT
jgi:hypothetical protein